MANLNYADVLWKQGEESEADKYYDRYIKLLMKEGKLERNLKGDKSISFNGESRERLNPLLFRTGV